MSKLSQRHWLRFGTLIILVMAFGVLIVVPLVAIATSISSSHDFLSTLFDPVVLATVKATLAQAVLSTTLALAVGYPLGLWLAATSRISRLALFQRLLALPFGVPSIVAVTSWVVIFGRSGLLARYGWQVDLIYSWSMVIFAHVFFNIPYVALLTCESRSQISPQRLENLRILGANHWQTIRLFIGPATFPALLTAALQVFNLCTMSFAIVLILGGGPPVATMETAIYERLRFGALDLTGATACAMWQLIINLVPTCALLIFLRRSGSLVPALSQRGTRARWTGAQGFGLFLCVAFILPYLCFLDGLELNIFGEGLFKELAASLAASAWLALLTSALAIALAILATTNLHFFRAHPIVSRLIQFFASLPAGVSALVLGVGIWQAYGTWIDPFAGNVVLIASIQGVLFFPLAFRIFFSNLQGFQEQKIQTVQCLGASPLQAFYYVEWPRWQRPLFVSWAMVLGASFAEVSAVSLFAGEGTLPLPVVVRQFLGQYRFEEAQWAAAFLFAASVGAMLLSSHFQAKGITRD